MTTTDSGKGSTSALNWVVSIESQRCYSIPLTGSLAYWTFARPLLEDLSYSLVVNAADNESAAVVEGSYTIWDADAQPQGYLDGNHPTQAGLYMGI